MESPATFVTKLEHEIDNFISLCTKQGKKAAFRLNTISDIPWEKYGVPQNFPNALFYDYTKAAARLGKTPDNYGLMFSYSQTPKYQKQVARALETNAPIAVVFRGFVSCRELFFRAGNNQRGQIRFGKPKPRAGENHRPKIERRQRNAKKQFFVYC